MKRQEKLNVADEIFGEKDAPPFKFVKGCLSTVTPADKRKHREAQLGQFGAASEVRHVKLTPEQEAALLKL